MNMFSCIALPQEGMFSAFEVRREKTCILGFQPGLTQTRLYSYMLKISNLESREIVLCRVNKAADQLRGYRTADLSLCFCMCKKQFSHDVAHIIIHLPSNFSMSRNHFRPTGFIHQRRSIDCTKLF